MGEEEGRGRWGEDRGLRGRMGEEGREGSNFFFQAGDGIRDAQESRGLGDEYKRQLTPY